ncbi:MAG: YqaE/Pmp3 family membrane protein [Saprospiraceae bacterium]
MSESSISNLVNNATPDKLLLVIIALFLPPLAVYLYFGKWNGTCWLNLILTLLFFIPGFIHALIVILGNK